MNAQRDYSEFTTYELDVAYAGCDTSSPEKELIGQEIDRRVALKIRAKRKERLEKLPEQLNL